MKKKYAILLIALVIASGLLVAWKTYHKTKPVSKSAENTGELQPGAKTSVPAQFNKTALSIDKPGSIWWIVNKTRPLPEGYSPQDLIVPAVKLRLSSGAEQMQFSKQSEPQLIEMFNSAAKDGVTLVFGSGYRSFALQKQLYNSYVAKDGQVAADRYSARPGTSEHQTGLAFDATSLNEKCHLEICYEQTPEGFWIKNNAFKYGFIIRYPDGKEQITGYQYEPWHLRYVGKELAAEVQNSSLALEEFFNL